MLTGASWLSAPAGTTTWGPSGSWTLPPSAAAICAEDPPADPGVGVDQEADQVRRVARESAPVLARSAQSYREALTAATPARAPAEPAAAVALY